MTRAEAAKAIPALGAREAKTGLAAHIEPKHGDDGILRWRAEIVLSTVFDSGPYPSEAEAEAALREHLGDIRIHVRKVPRNRS